MQFDLSARISLLEEYEDIEGQIEGFLMELASTEDSFFCDNLVDLVGDTCTLSPFQQVQMLFMSSLYEVDYCPIFDFLQMILQNDGDGGGESTNFFVSSAKELVMQSPDNIESKIKSIFTDEKSEEFKMLQELLKRNPTCNSTKLQTELLLTKHLELAIGVALILGSDHASIEQIEGWSEPLSLHYAFGMKADESLTKLVKSIMEKDGEDGRRELAETVVEFCRLEVEEGEPKSETDEEGRPSVLMTPRKSLTLSQSQPNHLNTVERTQIAKLLSAKETHAAHWSRLKQKSLVRRNTETDFSRLVDLPPMPPRLSQRSTSFESPKSLSKRKAVLVRVGDLDDSQSSASQKPFGLEDSQTTTTLEESVYAWETPMKKRSGLSQSQGSSAAATQPSLVLILETPPRASIGAACSQRATDFLPTKFSLS